jgi:hypothetical protein
VIFIDKLNISGIEMMILNHPLQEIASWAGNLLARSRQRRNIFFMVEGWPRLENPPEES